jgi:hypothetical protein
MKWWIPHKHFIHYDSKRPPGSIEMKSEYIEEMSAKNKIKSSRKHILLYQSHSTPYPLLRITSGAI